MNVKLWKGSRNDLSDPIGTIMENRGVEDYKTYMNLDDSCLNSPWLLDNMEDAVGLLNKHIWNKSIISILVDCDVDGFTSASMIFQYLKMIDYFGKINVLHHSGKEHGLSKEIEVPPETTLLIIPDAGSNDVEQCKELRDKGIDILILDHHICDRENPYAVIVNNQNGTYPNKELSGAGVVYKFLQAVDEDNWTDVADRYLDLVAVGNIGDVMDMHSHETKRLCTKGLARIVNPMICALIEANSFNIKGDPTINDVQFYIVPMMNALIRVGSSEQKKRMFRAMVGEEQTFQYTPTRGKNAGVTIDETLAQHVARECSSCKYQQNKIKDKAVAELQNWISKYGVDRSKVLFCNSTGILDSNLTGVVAIKLAEMYAKPCVLLREVACHEEEPDEDHEYFGGSMRNPDGSPIGNLKEFLMSTGDFESVLGHDNAAGVKIKKKNVPKAIADCNELLKNVTMSKAIVVDFDFDYSRLTVALPKTMHEMHKIWAQGISEPYFYIRNIPLIHSECAPMGKNGNMWKYSDEEKGIDFVCFADNGRMIGWINNDFYGDQEEKYINAVCRLSLNQYGNKVTPQAQIVDFEVI
nr:MAG TPA: single-stranded-DNA-specific exonuclease RecJ [Caudoviricetes sp.]